MENEKYSAAELSPNLVNEIKSFENRLSGEANKDVVVIVYEKDQEPGR